MRFNEDGTIQPVNVFEPSYAYLMAYLGPGEKLYYAYSYDARKLEVDQRQQAGMVARLLCVTRLSIESMGNFTWVHTTGWTGTTIGHWESDDLITWTGARDPGRREVTGKMLGTGILLLRQREGVLCLLGVNAQKTSTTLCTT